MKRKPSFSHGSILIETVLAGSIFVLVVVASIGAFVYGQEVSSMAGYRSRAALLAEEGLEAVRNMRNDDFANLANGTHGLSSLGGVWEFSGSADMSGIFLREVIIQEIDAYAKEVEVRVSWQTVNGSAASVAVASRLTNWSARQGGGGKGGGGGGNNNR
ncbi:MAG: hypothetical protein HYV77_03930 [Candidatus Wildermuthbacteria bacterium]|nr:hypothetical protein [Candidatus Wildermuthbacteria bacterium]